MTATAIARPSADVMLHALRDELALALTPELYDELRARRAQAALTAFMSSRARAHSVWQAAQCVNNPAKAWWF